MREYEHTPVRELDSNRTHQREVTPLLGVGPKPTSALPHKPLAHYFQFIMEH
jgi:hypothetical protein